MFLKTKRTDGKQNDTCNDGQVFQMRHPEQTKERVVRHIRPSSHSHPLLILPVFHPSRTVTREASMVFDGIRQSSQLLSS